MIIIYISETIGKKSNGGSSVSGMQILCMLKDKFGKVILVTDEWRSPQLSSSSIKVILLQPDYNIHNLSLRQLAKFILIFFVRFFRKGLIQIDAVNEEVLIVANSFCKLVPKLKVINSKRVRKICIVRGDTSSFEYQQWLCKDTKDKLASPTEYLSQFDGLIYVSKSIQENWRLQGVEKPSWYLPNSINEEEFDVIYHKNINSIRSDLNMPCQNFHVVVVGSLQLRKGQDIFCEIADELFEKIPNLLVHFVGGISPYYGGDQIAHNLKIAGRKRFILHGHSEKALEFIHAADICVCSSRSEAFPRTVAEYMAFGKATISTRVSGAKEMIQHNFNGIMIDIDDYKSLLDSITYLHTNKDISLGLGKAAFDTYWNNYNTQRQKNSFDAIFNALTDL